MILQALTAYYGRLLKDPNEDVPEPGFSRQKIHAELLLTPDGRLSGNALHNIQIPAPKGKKLIPRDLKVPEPVKRTSGVAANFLWDNTGYVLGAAKGKIERAKFEAFRTLAHEVGNGVDDPGMRAVLAFLDAWNPEDAPKLDHWDELAGLNMVFRLDGEMQYVHDRPAVRRAWLRRQDGAEAAGEAICLITGERGPVARLHPSIKGVRGAQSSGAALVSFNLDAFTSWAKEQNFNAPVGERAAFAYTTALNHLLAAGSRQRVQVGDATTLFWTEKPTQAEALYAAFLDYKDEGDPAHDTDLLQRLEALVEAVRDGKEPPVWDDPKTPFYVLGLSPNAARLSVRFWHVSTVGEMARRLGKHFADLAIERRYPKDPAFPSIWQLLIEVAPQRKSENIPPTLGGELMRAVLTGAAYPRSLVSRVVARIRAEQEVSYLKAALLKACLNRTARIANKEEEITVPLDPTCKNIGYLLGCLFAALEKAQQDALGKNLNATIKDRFYGAASSTPRSVFPRLLKLAQHHISKAEHGYYADMLIAKITERISATVGYPAHLDLNDQAMFSLGYYHQRNDNYRPNDEKIDPIKGRSAE